MATVTTTATVIAIATVNAVATAIDTTIICL